VAVEGVIGAIDEGKGLSIELLKPRSAGFVWEYMFARPMNQTPDMIEQHNILAHVAALVDAGAIRTTLARNLGPLSASALIEGHRLQESGSTIGKIVLDGF
jgi:NADPH:quinone reductase-like Zn-dependent oxidoreductase